MNSLITFLRLASFWIGWAVMLLLGIGCTANPVPTSATAPPSSVSLQIIEKFRLGPGMIDSEGQTSEFESVAWSPEGTRLAAGDEDGNVWVWRLTSSLAKDTDDQHVLHILKSHAFHASVIWSPDGTQLVTGGQERKLEDGIVRIWDAIEGDEVHTFTGHTGTITSIAWSLPNDTRFASSSVDGTVRVWDVVKGEQLYVLEMKGAVLDIAWSPDSTRLASTVNLDVGIIEVWNVTDEQQVRVWSSRTDTHTDLASGVSWSPDGTMLATASYSGKIRIWETVDWKLLHILTLENSGVSDVKWSPDGKMLAASGKEVWVWDVTNSQLLGSIKEHTSGVWAVDWSPNSKMLASAGRDGTVRVWEIEQ